MEADQPLALPPDLADVPVTDFKGRVEPMSLSDAQRTAVASIEDQLKQRDEPSLVESIEGLDRDDSASAAAEIRGVRSLALLAWWNLALGMEAADRRDLAEVKRCGRLAAYGFARLGVAEQFDHSVLLALSGEAGQLDLARKLDAADQVKTNIQNLIADSGRIDPLQRQLLAGNQLDRRYQEALETFRAGDQRTAEQLMRVAANDADTMAAKYPAGNPTSRLWRGTAGLLTAQAALMRALRLMSLYAFDQVPDDEAAAARKAAELLAEVSEPNSAAAMFYSKVLTLVEQMAGVMLRVLSLSFSTQESKFRELRTSVAEARKLIPKASGMEYRAMDLYCDQLDEWLSNLQRLARPKPRDRNLLRGLAACGTFILVLAVVEILNKAFGMRASASLVFGASTTLAVAAGFGVPGLMALRGGTEKGSGGGG